MGLRAPIPVAVQRAAPFERGFVKITSREGREGGEEKVIVIRAEVHRTGRAGTAHTSPSRTIGARKGGWACLLTPETWSWCFFIPVSGPSNLLVTSTYILKSPRLLSPPGTQYSTNAKQKISAGFIKFMPLFSGQAQVPRLQEVLPSLYECHSFQGPRTLQLSVFVLSSTV